LFTAAAILAAASAHAADWPGWRGPDRSGVSRETGLFKQWPQGGPKLLWQTQSAGLGYSTPSVAGDFVYVISNEGLENEYVQAISGKNGSNLWTAKLGAVGNPKQTPNFPAARSTPVLDGAALFALSSDGDLVSLNRADGNEIWRKSLRKDFGGDPGQWAYAESPLIDGDALICAPGGSEATIVALNKKTGETTWKTAIAGEKAGYASATIFETGGVKQYIAYLGKGLASVDAATGKLLWRYDRPTQGGNTGIPTPVSADDTVYCSAGRSGGGAVKVKNNQGVWETQELYFSPKLPTAIGGAVKVGPCLFGTSDGIQCVEFATGTVKWTDKSVGAASLCSAEGLLYLHGENNEVALVAASAEGYQEKGRFTPPGGPSHKNMEKAWAYPVVANGRLYIRDLGSIWCYDVKGEPAK
jgi:outer membrane protein assembly factor BamB